MGLSEEVPFSGPWAPAAKKQVVTLPRELVCARRPEEDCRATIGCAWQKARGGTYACRRRRGKKAMEEYLAAHVQVGGAGDWERYRRELREWARQGRGLSAVAAFLSHAGFGKEDVAAATDYYMNCLLGNC
ncbi:MAG: hypothetical protein ACYCOU_02455 [Sulfobacillus sp.]